MAEETNVADRAAELADEDGMVMVIAEVNVMDNGKRYGRGDALRMHKDLIPSHAAAGQVRFAAAAAAAADKKAQDTPRDKQQRGGRNK